MVLKILTVITFSIFIPQFICGAKILALTPVPSRSHHIWNRVLLIELAKRGHEVTYFGPDSEKTPTPNLTHVFIEGLYEEVHAEFNFEEMVNDGPYTLNKVMYEWLSLQCTTILNSKAFEVLLSYKPGTFDLIIGDLFGIDCLYPIIERLKVPHILTSPFGIFLTKSYLVGKYPYTSFIPNYLAFELTEKMSLMERTYNLLLETYSMLYRKYVYIPRIENIIKARIGNEFTPIEVFEKKVSFLFSNSHPVMDWVQPYLPKVIPAGALHVQPPKPLPENIKKFLDEANNGAIIFSLGSNVRSDSLNTEKMKSIIKAVGSIPQRVLWKWESEEMPGKPENVMIQKWLPQADCLAHKNVVAIVTHGGALSVLEAQARGIPMVAIPFIVDQHLNSVRITYRKLGIRVKYDTLTATILEKALRDIVENPIYRKNAKQLADLFRDQPHTPLQNVVFWTEYVIRHGSTEHLDCQAVHMSFYQTYSLDVAAVILGTVILVFKFVSYLLHVAICLLFSNKKVKTA